MTYENTVKRIISEHIKSAVFIDENAREAYSPSSSPELFEEKLSADMFREFAKHNILLSSYKYNPIDYEGRKSSLFNGRNLVLLDWKLDGDEGEDKALGIISDIINSKKILFCGIYTKERPEIVFNNILSFFSGITSTECDDVKMDLMLEEEECFNDFKSGLDDLVLSNAFEEQISEFMSKFANILDNTFFQNNKSELRNRLLECWCAYSNYQKANSRQLRITSYKVSDNVILIGNTFVVILNKTTTKFTKLLSKLTRSIAEYSNGFSLLMSIELNNIMQDKGLMMDQRISNVSRDLFAYHKMKDKKGFDFFIKEVMLSGVSLNLMEEKLSTIKSLQKVPNTFKPKIDEMLKLNTFYNSIQRPPNSSLLFGDVFKCNDDNCYYICITPLCDCANPKNENTFYFAKGHKVEERTLQKEINRSEEVFVSYLPDNVMIRWSDSTDKGKPIYITPIPLTIPKPIIRNNIMNAYHLKATISKKEKFILEYVSTLKQNYAQRIANHAFAHSIRVGISFFPIK